MKETPETPARKGPRRVHSCAVRRRRNATLPELFLVPEDRQRYERNRNDPQHDVFTAILFVRHGKQYTTPALGVQVRTSIPLD